MTPAPAVRATRLIRESMPLKLYVYGGDIPLAKDPDIHRSMTHGNQSAARLHYLRGEKPCEECRQSERKRWAAQSAARKAKRQAEKEAQRAGDGA